MVQETTHHRRHKYMKTIDEIFKINETKIGIRKLQGERIKYLNKEKGKLNAGLVGVAYSREIFKIKLKADRRMQRGKTYLKPNREMKEAIRLHMHEKQSMNYFEKRKSSNESETIIKSKSEFDEFALKNNLFEDVFPQLVTNKNENGYFDCNLISNNFAWISKDDKGVYRYYSKRSNGCTIGLNIYDLVEIVLIEIADDVCLSVNKGFHNSRKELARLFNILLTEEVWKDAQHTVFKQNLELCEGNDAMLYLHFPILMDYLKKYLPLVQFLNQWASDHLDIKFIYNNNPIMYISTTHIEKMMDGKFKQSTISRVINMLALIGFISKVPHDELSQEQVQVAKGIEGGRSRRWINFYQIPKYDEQVLMNAEHYIRSIISSEMKDIAKITEDRIRKDFGEEHASRVFLSSDGKKKKSDFSKARKSVEKVNDIPF